MTGVSIAIHWNRLLEWTTGLDYWTHPNCHKMPFTVGKRLNMLYFDNVGSLVG